MAQRQVHRLRVLLQARTAHQHMRADRAHSQGRGHVARHQQGLKLAPTHTHLDHPPEALLALHGHHSHCAPPIPITSHMQVEPAHTTVHCVQTAVQ